MCLCLCVYAYVHGESVQVVVCMFVYACVLNTQGCDIRLPRMTSAGSSDNSMCTGHIPTSLTTAINR